jgi:hypothetical protein
MAFMTIVFFIFLFPTLSLLFGQRPVRCKQSFRTGYYLLEVMHYLYGSETICVSMVSVGIRLEVTDRLLPSEEGLK